MSKFFDKSDEICMKVLGYNPLDDDFYEYPLKCDGCRCVRCFSVCDDCEYKNICKVKLEGL